LTETQKCVEESELLDCNNYVERMNADGSTLPQVEPALVLGCAKCYISEGVMEYYMNLRNEHYLSRFTYKDDELAHRTWV